ncbi:MAG TPA: hypothetical protein VG796_23935 [Verrucomicrobiales bacterium]|nr:hypothetical protein [Verrucomicrobiales bacterium]
MKPIVLILPLVCCIACDRKKPLTDEERAADLSKDRSDIAEKVATGRDREAKEQLLKEAVERAAEKE